MNTPTQEQFQTVIDTFEKAHKVASLNSPVDMMEPEVETASNHVCGTPMCHAGWYAAMKYSDEQCDESGLEVSYSDGVRQMAKDLGFCGGSEIIEWAETNPILWGNGSGALMFSDGSAFGKRSDSGFTLQTIIDHWKGVKERAAKQEAQPA